MKKLAVPALFAALILSGCAGSAEKPALNTVPKPNDEQRVALTKSLEAVDPALAGPRSVSGAVAMCRLIRSGAPETEQVERVSSIFRLDQGKPLTAEQNGLVLKAIKDNGFYTPA